MEYTASVWTGLITWWIIWIALCGIVARVKDRPVGIWLVLGALGGLIAFVILLVLPSKHKKCPKCAEDVKKGALVCKHCGYDFGLKPVADTKREVLAATVKKDSITCGNCGHEMRRGLAYCENCHEKLR